jgi:hypothetical protein
MKAIRDVCFLRYVTTARNSTPHQLTENMDRPQLTPYNTKIVFLSIYFILIYLFVLIVLYLKHCVSETGCSLCYATAARNSTPHELTENMDRPQTTTYNTKFYFIYLFYFRLFIFIVFYIMHDVSETGFRLSLQVEPTHLALTQILPLSVGPKWVGSTWRQRQNQLSETSCFKWKTERWLMSRIVIVNNTEMFTLLYNGCTEFNSTRINRKYGEASDYSVQYEIYWSAVYNTVLYSYVILFLFTSTAWGRDLKDVSSAAG